MTIKVLEVILESNRKGFAEFIGKLDEELIERIELLGPLGPELPRSLPIELKGIAVCSA